MTGTPDSAGATGAAASRRLAAILHADVVDYSALMHKDEERAHRTLADAMRRARTLVDAEGGRIVGTAGDAFLAEFGSVVAAVSAAIAFQSEEARRVDAEPMRFRIGVNLGDVIVDRGDLFGDGVNVAARVETLAPPGGIAVTAAAHAQLLPRQKSAFTQAGVHRLKNIAEPVEVFLASPPFEGGKRRLVRRPRNVALLGAIVVLVAAAAAMVGQRWPMPWVAEDGPGKPVLAVLPFSDPTASDETAYFSSGVTTDVILNLGRFREFIVLSWNAVSRFDPGEGGVGEAHRTLGADYVVDGTIRRSGDALRLSVQLVDAENGQLLWTERFDAGEGQLFEVEDRIARTVAGSLATNVTRSEQRRALARPGSSQDAYDLVLRARALMHAVDRESNYEAQALLETAQKIAPESAEVMAALAWSLVADVSWGWTEWPHETLDTALDLSERALKQDPHSVEALIAKSEALFLMGANDAARAACLQAIDLNPSAARAQGTCGGTFLFQGEPEAAKPFLELAFLIDPELPSWFRSNLGLSYYLTGDLNAAADALGRGARDFDEDPSPHAVLAAVFARLGKMEAARREVRRTLDAYPFFDAEGYAQIVDDESHSQELLAGLRAAGFE